MHSEPFGLHRRPLRHLLLICLLSPLLLSGCGVLAVADAAATVVSTGVKVTAKTVGAAVDMVIPDGDDDDSDN